MVKNSRSIRAADSLTGQRLDLALVSAGLTLSRSQGQKLILDAKVKVNNKSEKPSYKIQFGDLIEIEVLGKKTLELVPYDFDLDIIFEDEHLLVVNKPAGLVVHPAYGHESDTLINALIARNTKLSTGGDTFRPGLVHRIDKDTSGLLVLAKNEDAHFFLAKQFFKKTIHRRYWALCFANKKMNKGTIVSQLIRDPKNRQRFISTSENLGKKAITHYETLHECNGLRLFELHLETGRTHQIRVHLSSQQNPIVGDDVYNGKKMAANLKSVKLKKTILDMSRFALHAKELGFVHPVSKNIMKFSSPIPKDLYELYELGGFSEYLKVP
jgi:23S rRNA pseudouridine1911/1915/1917 synthase